MAKLTDKQIKAFLKWQEQNPMPQEQAEHFKNKPLIERDLADLKRWMIATGQIVPPKPYQDAKKLQALFEVRDRVLENFEALHPGTFDKEPTLQDTIKDMISDYVHRV